MKRDAMIERFKESLPYASEIFGVYQPLLGWRAKSAEMRFVKGVSAERLDSFGKLRTKFQPAYELEVNADRMLTAIPRLEPGKPGRPRVFDTVLMQRIALQLPPLEGYDPSMWADVLNEDNLQRLLLGEVREWYLHWFKENEQLLRRENDGDTEISIAYVESQIQKESITAGMLLALKNAGANAQLVDLFYPQLADPSDVAAAFAYEDPFDVIDPKKQLDRVGLSPIGIVHLFRQYFFEFDTFLGSPVGHIWLSPGSTVELVEISTRRTYTERYEEQVLETTTKAEKSTTDQDEISDAVKEDNRSETKFGANVKGEQKWIWGSANQSASFDLSKTQQTAREHAHKHMREQSEKLSTEIRKNYKSTLKVITENTDTTSKRYVLSNAKDVLANYEIRRKMRQVGVQVQDVGTYLCWQTYVDEPGQQLGISELVHVAKAPDSLPAHPEGLATPQPIPVDVTIEIPFEQTSEDVGDLDEAYRDGREVDTDFNEGDIETIRADFPQKAIPPQPGYYLDPTIGIDKGGSDVNVSIKDFQQADPKTATSITEVKFTVHLDYVNFKGNSPLRITAKLNWLPLDSLLKQVAAENEKRANDFTEKEAELNRKEYLTAARERIKLASKITSRRYDDLREEERIVVYRALIQTMLTKGIVMKDSASRHAVSELLDSIFDVDKMLYFVAPEWWKPRAHYGQFLAAPTPKPSAAAAAIPQPGVKIKTLGKRRPPSTTLSKDALVSWGGADSKRQDNYYITEDSDVAKLGASLGWLLQLDGDNQRNAFLNAPWVKAVIPIRPGKNKAALNWLKQVEGMNGIGPADMYSGNEPSLQGKTMLQVLEILADKVKSKQDAANAVGQYPPEEFDDDNKVSATPVDRVYEHGFYPLQGGFRATPSKNDPQNPDGYFEIFDQWVEVLPTDQMVAVEVKYDPKTGKQVDL
ncbi:hypothetical protein [Mesorhizobium sp. AA22]|uniref:hypothetical protein n=1 Tax=Mesorhizobium sp. AA22 TaxID=1854057 RepID=UPI0007EDAB21|nr:hypothetical protein [Mesorhizobium sp. AA22]QIA22858.1 peptidoglycan-binding protein [Mesorhizobium sp. AA22]